MKLLWAEKHANHTFIFFMGKPIYKRWDNDPKHPSILLNEHWPNEWINKTKLSKKEER